MNVGSNMVSNKGSNVRTIMFSNTGSNVGQFFAGLTNIVRKWIKYG